MQLLAAKLNPPRIQPGYVPRPRLYERLDAGLQRRLTLVSAPAGYGKTALLSSWISGLGKNARSAWISLDAGDNDPARFLAYLIGALQTIAPEIDGDFRSALQSPQPRIMEEVLTTLINQLDAELAVPDRPVGILVLDDYHHLTLQAIHDGITFLVEHPPKNLRIVISSRADPPLPLARLRGRGQLMEIRLSHLRFTADEAGLYLAQCPGQQLNDEDAAALTAKTEGWIAGLQMAAVALQGHQEAVEFIKDFSGTNRYILDYLLEEVLKRESRDMQDFLLKTSILDRMNGPLCDMLVDSARCKDEDHPHGCQSILEYLERVNLFVIPLDESREWYRYHHLFADLLRKRLLQTVGTKGTADLHRKATIWYRTNGLRSEAVEHAIMAKDFMLASDLIEDDLPGALWDRGEFVTIARWMKALPDDVVRSRKTLSIYYAFILFLAGRNVTAAGLLREVEEALGPAAANLAPPSRELHGMAAAVRAYMARFQGDADAVARYSQQALALLPAENTVWRGSVAMVAGDAYSLRGDTPSAGVAYAEVLRIEREAGNGYLALLASLKLATNEWLQGRSYRAVETCRCGLEHAEKTGLARSPMAGGLHAFRAEVLREWNDLDGALFHAETGISLCARPGNAAVTACCYLFLARVLLSRGDLDDAEEAISKLEWLTKEFDLPTWLIDAAPIMRAMSHLAQDRPQVAERTIVESCPEAGKVTGYHNEGWNIILARVLVTLGRREEVAALLDRLLQEAEAGGRWGRVVEILILQASAYRYTDHERALACMERALAIAEPEGYVRVFLEAGDTVAGLLRQTAARGLAAAYIGKLLGTLARPDHRPRPPTQAPADPLSERELAVLRLLAAGLSKPEIARELIVAESTVRSHVKNIYAKLDAHRRREAVERARGMGLL